jgi:hypothetical protein
MNSRFIPGILAALGVAFLGAPQALAQHSLLPAASFSFSRLDYAPQPSRSTPGMPIAAGSAAAPSLNSSSRWMLPRAGQTILSAIPLFAPASARVISRMQASIQSLDTPFLSVVRLPLASLWRGRIKVDGFESDLPTDYILWGLPGAGTVQGLSWSGGGHMGVIVPASDDSYGLHLTLHLHASAVEAGDNCTWHGMQQVVRAGRYFFRH